MSDKRRFPIQGETRPIWTTNGTQKVKHMPPTTVPWSVAEVAYAEYHARWPDQTLERLAERGGFGRDEFLWLLGGCHDEDFGKPTEVRP